MGEKLNDWAIQVEDELKLIPTTQTAEMQQWDNKSIYKVPECVTGLNVKAYKPQFVSFGPYHHMEPHLEPMEKHKHRALLHFLKRSQKPLVSYVAALAEVAQSLKDSYESLDSIWEAETDQFLMLMILDGCFMLEILRTSMQRISDYRDYSEKDPIFSEHGKLHVVPYIRRDMMMLENQLPMLLLTTLLAVEKEGTQQDEESVNKLIREFCFPNPWFPLDSNIGKCLHLLDVYRKSLLMKDTEKRKGIKLVRDKAQGHEPGREKSFPVVGKFGANPKGVSSVGNEMLFWFCDQVIRAAHLFQEAGRNEVIRSSTGGNKVIRSSTEDSTGGNEVIRSAMELSDAGIRFKKSRSASLNDISFTGGVLSLPPIVVDDTTESTFFNLIAFERFHVLFVGNEVTSYIFFMSKIIASPEDVSLLRARGIIKNAIGSDNDVAKLFNSLSKDVTLDWETSLYSCHSVVNGYWKERPVRVYLMKNYFRNPWAMLSLIAAVFLFFFTLAQTAYTIISYHDPKR